MAPQKWNPQKKQNESKTDNNTLSPISCVNLIIYSHVMCQKIEKYLPVRSGTCCPIVWADRATDGTPKMEPPKIVFQNESKIDNNILSPMSCVNLIIYSHVICPKKWKNTCPLDRRITSTSCVKKQNRYINPGESMPAILDQK